MYSINIKRVRGLMAEENQTIISLANAAGINRNTMAHYLEHPEKMPYGVVSTIADILCKTPQEAKEVFFAL